ncbi:MAG: primosomal protein N' [Deltaproteobacteria bacterium HGW-Deltaproteobacteria-23]|nr:MAG: primosomal protein N' [Deltaproteobacteria bacterium HGW-Deltaproteobacteria-23]
MQISSLIVEVAIPLHLERTFIYRVPEKLAGLAVAGTRALVPFGRRTVTGYILGSGDGSFSGEAKEIFELLDREPLFSDPQTIFYKWIASYYLHPLGEVIRTALPAGLTVMSRSKTVIAADGSLVSEETLSKSTGFREEKHFIATGKEAPPSLKGRAAAILLALNNSCELSASSVKALFGDSQPQLKRLEELGLITAVKKEVYRDPFRLQPVASDSPRLLNPEQRVALDALVAGIDSHEFAPFLLHGVTGSGKTEVYLQAIAHAMELGKAAMVLVPEIALTPQLVERFRSRFSCGIAVLHSGLSNGERYDEWRRIKRGEAKIVIGARSAIFAPLENPGIIVVDEEHEGSYKQSDGLRYNARDCALVLGKQHQAVVLLGSATPLVTTVHAARSGRMKELSLSARVSDRPMPPAVLVDQRGRKSETLSVELVEALRDNLENGGQSLLFLNRRGFAPWLVCKECGFILRCPNCSVTLTYHQYKKRHICHYCDHSIPAPSVCPECDGGEIGLFGIGTERLEEEVGALFPEARIARMDRDTTTGRGGHSRILKKLESGAIDILIGTQMIAKGHDFPGVTLVGVVSADTTLNLPDFRGSERGFQLVSQVAGRAGRGDAPGKVLVQTLNPEHFALKAAVGHDYEEFYRQEIAERQDAGYPPFSYLAALQFSSTSAKTVEKGAGAAAELLRTLRKKSGMRLEILGPAVPPMGMIRGRYRWQILLKSIRRDQLHRLLRRFRAEYSLPTTLRMMIDIDPLELL